MRRFFLLISLSIAAAIAIPSTASAGAFPSGERPIWIGVGGSGAVAGVENSGVGYFNLSLGLRLLPVAPEVTIREGVGRDPTHHITSIAAGARFLMPKLLMLRANFRVAFSHQHELPFTKFLQDPGPAIFGVHDEMIHRTGFETGAGLDVKLDPGGFIGIFGQINALFFPGSEGPPFYVLGEAGVSFAFGPTGIGGA
jgi:hypothetical protein